MTLADSLPAIQDLLAFAEQLRQTTSNLFAQLASLYADKQRLYAPLKLVRLSAAFSALCDALATLFAIDECVRSNQALPTAFALLRRSIDQIELEPGRFSLDPASAAALDAALSAVEARLLPATLFDDALNALAMECGPPPKRLCDEMAVHANLSLEAALGRITAGSERPSDRADLVGALCLAALHSRLAPLSLDRKLMLCAWGVVKRVHALPVASHLSVQPLDLLLRFFAPAALAAGPKDPHEVALAARREALEALGESVPREAAVFEAQAAAWLARTDSALVPNSSVAVSVVLGLRLRLLVQGLFLAARIRGCLLLVIHLHVASQSPMPPSRLRHLMAMVELLKAIEAAYARRSSSIALVTPHLVGPAPVRSPSLPRSLARPGPSIPPSPFPSEHSPRAGCAIRCE